MNGGVAHWSSLLALIRIRFSKESFYRILTPIAQAIDECEATITAAKRSGDIVWVIMAEEEEPDVVENLVGAEFIVCQAFMNSVIAAVRLLHDSYKSEFNRPLTTTSGSRADILMYGGSRVGGTAYKCVQVIDAAANYFKHHTEWRPGWEPRNELESRTIAIVRAMGATPGCTGNLRTLSEALGNTTYRETRIFADMIEAWHADLYNAYTEELKAVGQI